VPRSYWISAALVFGVQRIAGVKLVRKEVRIMSGIRCLLFFTVLVSVVAGCAETSFIKSTGKFVPGLKDKLKDQQAARILCLWEAAEGQGLEGQTTRGFAGQVLFFGYGDPAPIEVHGEVRIYQYDNFDPDERSPKPIHVFVFDAGGWNAHQSESTVGHSYNVFLPYVNDHSGTARCALKVEYIPKNGRPIFSPITKITLDGSRRGERPPRPQVRDAGPTSGDTNDAAGAPPTKSSHVSKSRIAGEQLDSLTIQLPKKSR
jgi:hypothetical protein